MLIVFKFCDQNYLTTRKAHCFLFVHRPHDASRSNVNKDCLIERDVPQRTSLPWVIIPSSVRQWRLHSHSQNSNVHSDYSSATLSTHIGKPLFSLLPELMHHLINPSHSEPPDPKLDDRSIILPSLSLPPSSLDFEFFVFPILNRMAEMEWSGRRYAGDSDSG